MKKIMTIVGARPQFIKASPVSHQLNAAGIQESIIHTGQHSDANMSEVFFQEMKIPKPDFFLGISGLSHGAMTGEMLRKIEEILLLKKPDAVLVYGDTNSTLAGAMAAAKIHIPVAHVEAGLRSFNMRMPEEINRKVTDQVSQWLFCPTDAAVKNLQEEGYSRLSGAYIENVGDVMLDAAMFFKRKAQWPSELTDAIRAKPFVLCTLHRQESTDDPEVFAALIEALSLIAEEVPVVWPVHPRARKTMESRGICPAKIHMISPVGYLEMLALLEACSIVATDSGGLQKEAFFFRKRCITLREETEWVELVAIGANTLCGSDPQRILKAYREATSQPEFVQAELYGTGHASERIVAALCDAT